MRKHKRCERNHILSVLHWLGKGAEGKGSPWAAAEAGLTGVRPSNYTYCFLQILILMNRISGKVIGQLGVKSVGQEITMVN